MIPETEFHEKLRKDFRTFLCFVHEYLGLPEPTPVQLAMADYLQKGSQRVVLMAFRGVGKSHITAAFVVWKLLCDAQMKILVVSASEDRAMQFATFVRQLINEMPGLEYLRAARGQRDSVLSFDVGPATASQSPSVKCAGITGQITGSRADVLVADDIEVPNNSATQKMREKLSEAVKEFDAIIKPGDIPRIIYLGTPQLEDSLYNKLPERGYTIRIWPARVPANDDVSKYGGSLDEIIYAGDKQPGDPTDPKRFDNEDLMKREASYGKAGFALQFMLNTSLSDEEKFPLKVQNLIVMSMDLKEGPLRLAWGPHRDRLINEVPNLAMRGDMLYGPMNIGDVFSEWQNSIMSIDPSGRGADETGYAVGHLLNSRVFVPEAGGLKGGYDDDTLLELAEIAKRHKVKRIIIESNFGDGMFSKLLQPVLVRIGYPCTIEEVRHSTQKERRIADTLEPLMGSHKLVIDPKVLEKDWESIQKYDSEKRLQMSLVYQMTRLTRDRGALIHDDRLDALAIMAAYYVAAMAVDEAKHEQDHKQMLLEQELLKFTEHAKNRVVMGPSGFPQQGNPSFLGARL